VLIDVFPLYGLVLRTPRLELRLPSLEQLAALGELAGEGVHDPAVMPFAVPWTDLPPAARARSVLQHHLGRIAELTPAGWTLPFVVLDGDEPVGMQAVGAVEFAVTREVHTGSWLGLRHHGRGIGTEMRAAVLHLAFAGLGADTAASGAHTDNTASLGVARKLGYVPDGLTRRSVRDRLVVEQRLRLDRETWEQRRTVPVQIEGPEACRSFLGAELSASRGA
jgi:RimJ/RimL family protein N-acetyltransferase